MHTISIISLGGVTRPPDTREPDSGSGVEPIGRDAVRPRRPRAMTRLRLMPVIGVLFALIFVLTGCCAGYCSSSAPPVGSGVHQTHLERPAIRAWPPAGRSR